jgi:hypothetical protein
MVVVPEPAVKGGGAFLACPVDGAVGPTVEQGVGRSQFRGCRRVGAVQNYRSAAVETTDQESWVGWFAEHVGEST